MSGKIHKITKGKKPNAETQIVGGSKITRDNEGETRILDQRTKAKSVEIQSGSDDKIVVKTHTRTRPKGHA